MRVRLSQETCCGAGQCVLAAPDVFDQRDDDGVAVLLDEEPPTQLWDQVRDAAARCPARCIQIVET
jgi:ferredoxin